MLLGFHELAKADEQGIECKKYVVETLQIFDFDTNTLAFAIAVNSVPAAKIPPNIARLKKEFNTVSEILRSKAVQVHCITY